jgi:hypothetical protein
MPDNEMIAEIKMQIEKLRQELKAETDGERRREILANIAVFREELTYTICDLFD